MSSRSLAHQPLGAPARILAVGGGAAFRRRIMELGLVPGTTVTVTAVAPLGDPLELRVRGTKLSIRRHEAEAVTIEGAEAARVVA